MARFTGVRRGLCLLLAALLCVPLLGGCSPRLRKNIRIYRQAKARAEAEAADYVREQYGIDVTTMGYDVQGSQAGFSFYASSAVLVPVSYGDEVFAVYLDLSDPAIRWDNRQRRQIARTLEAYLLERCGLPEPLGGTLTFSFRDRRCQGQFWVRNQYYDSSGMADFLYQGERAEELLPLVARLEYQAHFAAEPGTLAAAALDPADWPAEGDFALRARLYSYRDPEAYRRTGGISREEPLKSEWFSLWEDRTLSLTVEGGAVQTEARGHTYWTEELGGCAFVGRDGALRPLERCLRLQEDGPVWQEEEPVEQGLHVREYRQAGPALLFQPPEEAAEPELVCQVPESAFGAGGEALHLGRFWPEEDRFEVLSRPLSRDGTRCFTLWEPGCVYALLQLEADYIIPDRPHPGAESL